MIGRTTLISHKYFRYIACWLLFGVLGIIIFSKWNMIYGLISVCIAFVLTFGIDSLKHFIVRQKVLHLVKEKPLIILDAARGRGEKSGFLVVTESYILFVPLLRKIKTVLDIEKIIRYYTDGEEVQITAKFPNRFRTFSFYVLSTKKLLPILKEYVGESLPYKYDKLQKDIYYYH